MTISDYDFIRVFQGFVVALDGSAPTVEQWNKLVEQFNSLDVFQEPVFVGMDFAQEQEQEQAHVVFTPGEALRQHLAKRDED